MEMQIDWNLVAQGGAAFFTAIGGAYIAIKGKAKSTGTPPPERSLSVNETREVLNCLKDQVTRNREIMTDEMRRVLAAIDRLEYSLRQLENSLRKDIR